MRVLDIASNAGKEESEKRPFFFHSRGWEQDVAISTMAKQHACNVPLPRDKSMSCCVSNVFTRDVFVYRRDDQLS